MLLKNINLIIISTTTLFLIGLLGAMFNRKNILLTIISIEIMLLAVNLNFAFFSIYLDDIVGQIFVLFILSIAAAESAIGLSLISVLYNSKNSIEFKPIKKKFNSKI